MRYIIYGAGVTGCNALRFLGEQRVFKFADNNKSGMTVMEKEVVTYEKMLELYESKKDIIIVIASEMYWEELEQQIYKAGIKRYFVFHNGDMISMNAVLPSYCLFRRVVTLPYMQSLARYNVAKCRFIGIYGTNRFLPYLIAEVMEQSPFAEIRIILADQDSDNINSLGFDVVSFDTCREEIDCLILNASHCEDPIREQLSAIQTDFKIVDLSELETFEPVFQHKELAVYKDIYKGKRVFIIGNGPSLRVEDLNKLYDNNEICIAFNKIYKIYAQTKWRADYIGMTDWRIIQDCCEDIPQIEGEIFMDDNDFHNSEGGIFFPNVHYFHQIRNFFYPNRPCFSDDFTKGFYSGCTITYDFGIQLAAYMGFSEIYLLGIDHNFTENITDGGNHFIKDYFADSEIKNYKNVCYDKDKAEKQYEMAELYSRQHGFRIYNATRGGKLEVFERVDFDSLFD